MNNGLYNGIISAIRKNEILMYITVFINLNSIVKRERSHNQKPKHHYEFTHITLQKRQAYRESDNQISNCQGQG